MMSLQRRTFAEALGTLLLVAIVVGSGRMGEMLSPGNAGIALLANTLATGLGLWVLIELLAPVSGAHFNPIISLAFALRGELRRNDAAAYVTAQCGGAVGGTALAHAMFGLPLFGTGIAVRYGSGIWLGEAVASGGLLLTLLFSRAYRPERGAMLVAAFIASAYWFTSSTAFANPAVTLARALTPTFAGIRPADVPMFVMMQLIGMCLALALSPRAGAAQRGT